MAKNPSGGLAVSKVSEAAMIESGNTCATANLKCK